MVFVFPFTKTSSLSEIFGEVDRKGVRIVTWGENYLRCFLNINRERWCKRHPWHWRARPCKAHLPRLISLNHGIHGFTDNFLRKRHILNLELTFSFLNWGSAAVHENLHPTISHLHCTSDGDRDYHEQLECAKNLPQHHHHSVSTVSVQIGVSSVWAQPE